MTFEFLEDITLSLKPGAPSAVVGGAVGIRLPGVVATPNRLGFSTSVSPTPSAFFSFQFTASDPLTDLTLADIGTIPNDSVLDIVTTIDSPDPLFGTFEPGGPFTFKQSVIEWPFAGTDSPTNRWHSRA